MKHLLILLSLLILTFPLVAQETGVLYFKKVNGKYGWFESHNLPLIRIFYNKVGILEGA